MHEESSSANCTEWTEFIVGSRYSHMTEVHIVKNQLEQSSSMETLYRMHVFYSLFNAGGRQVLQNRFLPGNCLTTGAQLFTKMLILCNRPSSSLCSSNRSFTGHYKAVHVFQGKKAGNRYLLKVADSYSCFLIYLQSRKCHCLYLC